MEAYTYKQTPNTRTYALAQNYPYIKPRPQTLFMFGYE